MSLLRATFAAIIAVATVPGTALALQAAPDSSALLPYRINPGDELEVYVWGEERLQRVIRVLPTAPSPFRWSVGSRPSAACRRDRGADRQGAGDAVSRRRAPGHGIGARATGLQFSVIGKVRSPGSFTPGKYVNVLEAIGIAGGPSEFADVSGVTILRKQGDRLVQIRVRLTDALKGSPSARDLAANGLPQLQSGDTVIVP